MAIPDFLVELENCELCEHRCGVNRLAGETGVCRVTTPIIASATLHPAPPESYTVFMAGCNYKCLNCQNWTISQYPDNGFSQRGGENPEKLARECVGQLGSRPAQLMGADRIFFSGGEPTIHLPYIEKVVEEARKVKPDTKINVDTNGYMTDASLKRVLDFTTSITFDLKAYHDEVHLALTGTTSGPALRNAEYIGKNARAKLWEYRIVVIPKVNEEEIRPLVEFIAEIDPSLPVCFLAFRPNFVLESHPGPSPWLMDKCVHIARETGLTGAYWCGHPSISGTVTAIDTRVRGLYGSEAAELAASYALRAGCHSHPRECLACTSNQACKVKRYIPRIQT